MIRTITTLKDAAQEWVREMNAISTSIISKLMSIDIDSWHEVTVLCEGCRVYCYNHEDYGYITKYNELTDKYTIQLDSDEEVSCCENELERQEYDTLPMWGTMWSFGDNLDDYWLYEEDGIRKMSECGFRIYHSDDFGFFFGIDGAGYNFYESHWIPLYKKRGLQWHDKEEENE